MKRLKTVRFLSRIVGALVAVGLPLFIAMIWLISYLSPFRTGRTVLAYHSVWLTKGYEAAVARGKIEVSMKVRQYFDGDSEPTLHEFLDTGAGPITGWYRERILSVAGDTSSRPVWAHLGIYLVSERLLSDDGTPTGIIMPCWILMALSLGIASRFYLAFFRSRRVWRRLLHGRCPECGYDLRASGRVCPEWGSEILTAPAERAIRSNRLPLLGGATIQLHSPE